MASYYKYAVKIEDFRIHPIDCDMVVEDEILYKIDVDVGSEQVTVQISLQADKNKTNIFNVKLSSEKTLCQSVFAPIASNIINNLLNKIAFIYVGAKVGEPWLTDFNCADRKYSTSEIQCSICVDTKNRDKHLLETLCKAIKDEKNYDTDDYTIYRSAMNNSDVVAKYMFLYQMLLYIHKNASGHESQAAVDAFIIKHLDEERHMYKKWPDSQRTETIFTRLRNQVGHNRGKTPSETRKEMERKISELTELVRVSIEANTL